MSLHRAVVLGSCCVLSLAGPLRAQDEDRIWGRVHVSSGDVLEGFIRWDRNEGSWVDVLDGSKTVPEVNYEVWLRANEAEPAVRSIDLHGYRISWDEEDPDFPVTMSSGIRFGHLESLTVLDAGRVRLDLRSGRSVELEGGSTDLGRSIRRIDIDVPGGEAVRLRWRDLERVEFASAPPEARAASPRLFATVDLAGGRSFTGYLAWDLDEILASDVLDGEEIDGRRQRSIPFAEVASVERMRRGARVTLRDGEVVDLTGSNDVDRGHRGVQISDPDLGHVDADWEDVERVRFHEPERALGRDAFDGGRPLRGTVTTTSGERLSGLVRWDADEESSWELLDGRADGVVLAIELGLVARVARDEAVGAVVTLRDGRTFELHGGNDVGLDNRGVMLAPEGADLDDPASWRLIRWDDFDSLELDLEASSASGSGP